MTDEIYDKACKIRRKLLDTSNELLYIKDIIYGNGYLTLGRKMPEKPIFSHILLDYIRREDIAREILEIMEKEIKMLEKEYEEL